MPPTPPKLLSSAENKHFAKNDHSYCTYCKWRTTENTSPRQFEDGNIHAKRQEHLSGQSGWIEEGQSLPLIRPEVTLASAESRQKRKDSGCIHWTQQKQRKICQKQSTLNSLSAASMRNFDNFRIQSRIWKRWILPVGGNIGRLHQKKIQTLPIC